MTGHTHAWQVQREAVPVDREGDVRRAILVHFRCDCGETRSELTVMKKDVVT
jgi:hypothetical protein